MKVLPMGNPNVGKSEPYAGTTIEYTRGSMKIGGETVEVIDVPGTYSLEPTMSSRTVCFSSVAADGYE